MASDTEIVAAVREILRQLYRLTDIGLPPARIDRVRREVIFFLYEGGEAAKWSYDRPHSAKARQLHRQARAGGRAFNGRNYPITYEHAVPLVTLRDGLRAATASIEAMADFLDRHIAGVVILKEEDGLLRATHLHRSMPAGAAPHDRLARYRAAGIEFEADDLRKLGDQYIPIGR